MSAVENAIEKVIEYHETNCNGGMNSPCNLSVDARAELAALRTRADEVTALQQAVEEARRLLIDITDVFGHDSSIDAWLAAHPAPEQVMP